MTTSERATKTRIVHYKTRGVCAPRDARRDYREPWTIVRRVVTVAYRFNEDAKGKRCSFDYGASIWRPGKGRVATWNRTQRKKNVATAMFFLNNDPIRVDENTRPKIEMRAARKTGTKARKTAHDRDAAEPIWKQPFAYKGDCLRVREYDGIPVDWTSKDPRRPERFRVQPRHDQEVIGYRDEWNSKGERRFFLIVKDRLQRFQRRSAPDKASFQDIIAKPTSDDRRGDLVVQRTRRWEAFLRQVVRMCGTRTPMREMTSGATAPTSTPIGEAKLEETFKEINRKEEERKRRKRDKKGRKKSEPIRSSSATKPSPPPRRPSPADKPGNKRMASAAVRA